MTTHIGIGVSHHRNPQIAGHDVIAQATEIAGLSRIDHIFLFASVGYPQETLIRSVYQASQGASICGCSGEGIIARDLYDENPFVVAAMVIQSDEIFFTNGITPGLKRDSAVVGEAVGRAVQLVRPDDAIALMVFPDGLTCTVDHFFSGFESVFPSQQSGLPLVGGFAADHWEARQTYQYCDNQVVSDSVAWTLMSGKAELLTAISHGCSPIGRDHLITRAAGNVIYEIDNQPALDVVRGYLTEEELRGRMIDLPYLCLAFRPTASRLALDGETYVIRYLPAKDEVQRSVTIPTIAEVGMKVWMARRDYQKIAYGIDRLTSQMSLHLEGRTPLMVFQFDCAGRGKVIFSEAQKHDLLHTLQSNFDRDVPWLGFATYGEIGPMGRAPAFHNYTAVLAMLVANA